VFRKFSAWIIVPCYNEEKRLSIKLFTEFLASHQDIGICFVNDGSHDRTIRVLENIQKEFPTQVALLNSRKNRGKAEAVRSGFFYVSQLSYSQYIGFWDADLATPLSEIEDFIQILNSNKNIIIASGSRISRMGALIERTFLRNLEGKIFAILSSFVLGLKFRDTQCGAKVIERETALKIFTAPFISRWCFDVEIFARLRNLLGQTRVKETIYEVPLQQWKEIPESKIRFKDSMKMILDLGRIFIHYRGRSRHETFYL
jgi:dolichyl-phosphate beta-glucosyltransferase